MSPRTDKAFAVSWLAGCWGMNRCFASSMGEFQVILTLIVLDRDGIHPNLVEVAKLTGLPKSSVSRYVTKILRAGYVTEEIDPGDRRRRVLHITDQAREDMQATEKMFMDFLKLHDQSSKDTSGKALMEMCLEVAA